MLKTKLDNREHRLEVHISAWMGGSCDASQRLATLCAWAWAVVKLTMRVRRATKGACVESLLGGTHPDTWRLLRLGWENPSRSPWELS